VVFFILQGIFIKALLVVLRKIFTQKNEKNPLPQRAEANDVKNSEKFSSIASAITVKFLHIFYSSSPLRKFYND
jgi:hypothetical protein